MWLRKAYLSFHRRANALMLDHGVTADQFVLLSVLAREPGIMQITIVERTASDPNTVAAILRLLEERRTAFFNPRV
jgi:DNA-binding MarR family transcriptional regulator